MLLTPIVFAEINYLNIYIYNLYIYCFYFSVKKTWCFEKTTGNVSYSSNGIFLAKGHNGQYFHNVCELTFF